MAMDKGSVLDEVAAVHDATVYERSTMHAAKSVGSDRRARTHPSESSSVTRPAATHPHPSTVKATPAPTVEATAARPVSATPALRERSGCAVEQQDCTACCH